MGWRQGVGGTVDDLVARVQVISQRTDQETVDGQVRGKRQRAARRARVAGGADHGAGIHVDHAAVRGNTADVLLIDEAQDDSRIQIDHDGSRQARSHRVHVEEPRVLRREAGLVVDRLHRRRLARVGTGHAQRDHVRPRGQALRGRERIAGHEGPPGIDGDLGAVDEGPAAALNRSGDQERGNVGRDRRRQREEVHPARREREALRTRRKSAPQTVVDLSRVAIDVRDPEVLLVGEIVGVAVDEQALLRSPVEVVVSLLAGDQTTPRMA